MRRLEALGRALAAAAPLPPPGAALGVCVRDARDAVASASHTAVGKRTSCRLTGRSRAASSSAIAL